jgi:BMFP domain-containing protein YqiC
MLNAKIFEDISIRSSKAANSIPVKGIEKNMRTLLTQRLARLELVTRELFLIQTQVFICTRQMLFAPEARVAGLETRRDSAAK